MAFIVRHVAVQDLFAGFKKRGMRDFEAKLMMLPITGHETIQALEKYMRDSQIEIADDHSQHISLNI